MRVLVAFDTVDEGFEELMRECEVIRPPKGRDFSREELLDLLPNCEVLCAVFDIPVDSTLLARGAKLKLVANYAVGFNNIDIAYCQAHGIAVANAPQSVVAPTAELTMALLLSCSRRTAEQDRLMRAQQQDMPKGRLLRMGVDLWGKTVGILGYGNIGRAVGERCRAFGMRVVYHKRRRLSEAEENALGITYASKPELLQRADVVSLHTPLTPETHHYIGQEELALMKPNAILLNTARGPVVDEAALIAALQNGRIFAAGLDVFEHNDVPSPELYALPNVVMTPHVGSQTYEGRVATVVEMCDNVLGFIKGDRPVSRVV